MGRILSIDFGLKRIGIAVTDPLQIIATGLTTVENKEIIPFLKNYLVKEKVDEFVIGYPLNMDGSSTHATSPVEKFILSLQKHFPAIPVYKEDERMTSKMAVQTMVEGGIKKMKRRDKGMIDKISAVLILQSYLETKNI